MVSTRSSQIRNAGSIAGGVSEFTRPRLAVPPATMGNSSPPAMERGRYWPFYFLVIFGFQSAGSLNFQKNAQGAARLPPGRAQKRKVNDDASKESLVWPRLRAGLRRIDGCVGGRQAPEETTAPGERGAHAFIGCRSRVGPCLC